MLENFRASQSGSELRQVSDDSSSFNSSKLPQIESPRRIETPNKLSRRPVSSSNSASSSAGPSLTADKVESLLWKSDSSLSAALQKIAVAAAKFNPQRDGVFLNAFRAGSLLYSEYRVLLKRVLFLDFNDEEFLEVCRVFDSNSDNFIDGEEFLVGFTLLSSAWKDKTTRKFREIDRKFLAEQKEKEEREKAIAEAKLEEAAVFHFTEEERESALSKIKTASRKYMKNHPSAVGLDGFDVKFVKPGEFRELLKRTFNVQTTRAELGALIRYFNADPSNPLVECGSFIIKFMKMGHSQRDELRLRQLEESRNAELQAQMHHQRLIEEINSKMEIEIDRDYTEQDKARALAIVNAVAVKFQKHHPSSMSLDGFDAKFLTPGAFREMLKRTFNVSVTNKELGALVDFFFFEDDKDMNKVDCKKFLLYFAKVGFKGKRDKFSNDLEKQRREVSRQIEEHKQKIDKQWEKMSLSAEKLDKFTEEDTRNVLEKVARAALSVDKTSALGSSLAAFDAKSLSVAEFREICRRTININFTDSELAAAVELFQMDGSNKQFISCTKFLTKFQGVAFEQKEKLRSEHLQKKFKSLQELQESQDKIRQMLERGNSTAAVDFNYSVADSESGLQKMKAIAKRYDKSHPSSPSLQPFEVSSMSPSLFRATVAKVFFVTLTPKEAGAVAGGCVVCDDDDDDDDGDDVDSSEVLGMSQPK